MFWKEDGAHLDTGWWNKMKVEQVNKREINSQTDKRKCPSSDNNHASGPIDFFIPWHLINFLRYFPIFNLTLMPFKLFSAISLTRSTRFVCALQWTALPCQQLNAICTRDPIKQKKKDEIAIVAAYLIGWSWPSQCWKIGVGVLNRAWSWRADGGIRSFF